MPVVIVTPGKDKVSAIYEACKYGVVVEDRGDQLALIGAMDKIEPVINRFGFTSVRYKRVERIRSVDNRRTI